MATGLRRSLVPIAALGTLVLGVHAAGAAAATPLYPLIVADPPTGIALEVSTTSPTGQPTEPRLLLRFNGFLHNKGPGALDIRGRRSTSAEPMKAFQRIYDSEGAYAEEPIPAQLEYVSADGHNHWHLQHIAFYSLWNAAKGAEVAPAQKVGFCLDDSEHVEPAIGPSEPVYSDSATPSREFCRENQPEATEVFEGISPGWRDLYEASLAFQWVDVSEVAPGEYWLRAEVDPEHMLLQAPGEKPPAFAAQPTVVPGYDAQAQAVATNAGQAVLVALASQRWSGSQAFEQPSPAPRYALASAPAHGTLGAIEGNHVLYTPQTGFAGTDSFTFYARDPGSAFPLHPVLASVSVSVVDSAAGSSPGAVAPGSGAAPVDALNAGTALNPNPAAAPTTASKAKTAATLRRPGAVRVGRKLRLTELARASGRLRIAAYLYGHRLGVCVARVRAGQPFVCTVRLPAGVGLRAPIAVRAVLRAGRHTWVAVRPPARVPARR